MKKNVLCLMIIMILLALPLWAGGEKEAKKEERVHVTGYWTDSIPIPEGRMYEYICDKFNTDFEILQVPQVEYAEKLTLAMASGDVADMIEVRGHAYLVKQLIDGDFLLPLDPYLDDYPHLKKFLSDPEVERYSIWEGKTYVVPSAYFYPAQAHYYRKDILDKYGLKIPETIDEFYEVGKVVVEKEGIPFYTSLGLFFGNQPFWAAYTDVGFGDPWKWKDGKYVDLTISEEYKKSLKILHRFYKEGILDPEFILLTDKLGRAKEKFTTGKIACIPLHCEANYFYDELVGLTEKNIPGADVYATFNPVGPAGTRNGLTESPYSGMWFLLAKNAKHPEKFLQLWDFLYSPEGDLFNKYGIEGIHWTKDASGNIVVNEEEVAKDTGSPSDPISKWRWWSDIVPAFIPESSIERERQEELIAYGQKYGVSPYVVGYATKDFLTIRPVLAKMRDEYYTKFILGELDIDANWDEFVAEYRKAGYDFVEKDVNEYCRQADPGKCKK